MQAVKSGSLATIKRKKTTIDIIYDYVFSQLPAFVNGMDTTLITNEKGLTQELVLHLDVENAFSEFTFHHEFLEDTSSGNSPSTDFAVISKTGKSKKKPLVKFEAKRLDSKLPNAREKEYVVGQYDANGIRTKNSGAIERFKNETHGKDIKYGGIIGFVQTETLLGWLKKIRQWIDQQIMHPSDPTLEWNAKDKPSEIHQYLIHDSVMWYRCYSISKRKTQPPISFQHFWIDLTKV